MSEQGGSSSQNSVFYSLIAHGNEIIAEVDIVPPAARALALVVLERIDLEQSRKATFIHDDMAVHYITRTPTERPPAELEFDTSAIAPEGLTYLVVTRHSERRVPFTYLLHLERYFIQQLHEVETVETIASGEVEKEMRRLITATEKGEYDAAGLAKAEIEQVKNIMVENVERVLERGERINLLVSKTDRMNTNAAAFRKRTVAVRRSMWWQNVKMLVLLILVAVGVTYLLLGYVCGLPLFENCRLGD